MIEMSGVVPEKYAWIVCRMRSSGKEEFWNEATASWGSEDEATRYKLKQTAAEVLWQVRKQTKGKRLHPLDYYLSCVGDWAGDDDRPRAA